MKNYNNNFQCFLLGAVVEGTLLDVGGCSGMSEGDGLFDDDVLP